MLATDNPYESPRFTALRPLDVDRPWRDEVRVQRVERGFLYRRVVLEAPLEFDLEYRSHNFMHHVSVDGHVAAKKLPVVRFARRFDFELVSAGRKVPVVVEVRIGRFMRIIAFRVEVAGQTVYSEGVWKLPSKNL